MGLQEGADDFGQGIYRLFLGIHKNREADRQAVGFLNGLAGLELPDPTNPEKTKPVFSKEGQAMIRQQAQLKGAELQGQAKAYQQALPYILQGAMKEPRRQVQAGGQSFSVPETTAFNATVEQPEREARTAHVKEQTTGMKAEREAAATQASVMMDIGGGNMARVPVNELIKHPEFLRDQSAKDLNNQIFASTGLGIPQIAQGWNKRVVNGQLTFEAPVVQQTIDPISQRPIPKYNADGTPAYELMPPNEKGEKFTKTMRYQVPQEFTPDVLRLTGTQDVQGAEQIKIPKSEDRSTKIIPGTAGVGTGPQVGDTRMINGVMGRWDGRGWIAVGQ